MGVSVKIIPRNVSVEETTGMVVGAMEKSGEQAEPLLTVPHPPPSYGVPVPVPIHDPYNQPPAYVLLPVYPRRRRRSACHCCGALLSSSSLITYVFFLAVLATAAFFLWPSDPEVKIAHLRLNRIHVSTSPIPSIDVSLGLDLIVRNRDFFSLDYRSIDVAVSYRGRRLGSVKSGGGHIRARGVSYVDAELHLNGIRIIDDVFYLIQDLASGSIPFDTITEVQGQLHLFFLDVPIQGRFSCAVHVNAKNQTVVHQDCYPE